MISVHWQVWQKLILDSAQQSNFIPTRFIALSELVYSLQIVQNFHQLHKNHQEQDWHHMAVSMCGEPRHTPHRSPTEEPYLQPQTSEF